MNTQWSYEMWQENILEVLGDGVMTVNEVQDKLPDKPDGFAPSPASVYQYLQRMTWSGVLSREPTGQKRPKWHYFKTERPLTGTFAEIVAGVELDVEAPE